jgi:RNA binding exosome subunit
MIASVEQLAAQAIALSTEDRSKLLDFLLASLPDEADCEVETAWSREIQARVGAVESGNATLISSADVHAQARKIFEQ